MFGFMMLIAALIGFWIVGSILGLVFKLVFGLVGGLFTVLGGLLGLGLGALALLAVVPVLALAMLPLWLPVLCVGLVIWLLVRASRRAPARVDTAS